MTEEEVLLIERQLRELLGEIGLHWVLVQVDASMAEGRVEAVNRSEEDYALQWASVRSTRSSSQSKLAVTNRPLSSRERVEYLIDALFRMLVDLPIVNKQTWEYLNAGHDGLLPLINGLTFVPDEDAFGHLVTVVGGEELQQPPNLDEIHELLQQLREAMNS